jgi:hypothetical protein
MDTREGASPPVPSEGRLHAHRARARSVAARPRGRLSDVGGEPLGGVHRVRDEHARRQQAVRRGGMEQPRVRQHHGARRPGEMLPGRGRGLWALAHARAPPRSTMQRRSISSTVTKPVGTWRSSSGTVTLCLIATGIGPWRWCRQYGCSAACRTPSGTSRAPGRRAGGCSCTSRCGARAARRLGRTWVSPSSRARRKPSHDSTGSRVSVTRPARLAEIRREHTAALSAEWDLAGDDWHRRLTRRPGERRRKEPSKLSLGLSMCSQYARGLPGMHQDLLDSSCVISCPVNESSA